MKLKKSSGEFQPFDREKFEHSLFKSGAPQKLVYSLSKQAQKMEAKLKSTDQVFNFAQQKLIRENKRAAMRYNLKRAIFELGPTGYPFEKYVARLLEKRGYKTRTNIYVRGFCVSHEVDIIAEKDNRIFLFECKYHRHRGIKSNIKTILYVKARFDDIIRGYHEDENPERLAPKLNLHQAVLVTNTKHTQEVKKYAQCTGIQTISWGYPKSAGLETWIEESKLYPITILLNLNRYFTNRLFEEQIVTTEDLLNFKDWSKFGGHDGKIIRQLQTEAKLLM